MKNELSLAKKPS